MQNIDWGTPEIHEKVLTIAEGYYKVYSEACDYTNWQGLRIPDWGVLPARQKHAWCEVAKNSIEVFTSAFEDL